MGKLNESQIRNLIETAIKSREFSYSPYSNFQVGAALLAKNGTVYTGCNIENAGYSATNCAERTAFFRAVYDGEREFEKIAVVGALADGDPDVTCAPCGVCRQVMMEFCDPETFTVVLANGKDEQLEILLNVAIFFLGTFICI